MTEPIGERTVMPCTSGEISRACSNRPAEIGYTDLVKE